MDLEVRESHTADIEKIVDYFVNADADFLKGMGADKTKLPNKADWIEKLKIEYSKTYREKGYYYVVWMIDGIPCGHSNINHIEYGKTATMHLHLWKSDKRKSGLGFEFLKQTIPFYFEKFELENLVCEPFSENIAPNKTLKKYGFDFKRAYETIPGPINLPQIVNRYELTKERFEGINK